MFVWYGVVCSAPEVWAESKLRHTVIPYWFARHGYIDSMADLIIEKYDKFTDEQKKRGVDVLFR
jgi:protoheme ferro-lyase